MCHGTQRATARKSLFLYSKLDKQQAHVSSKLDLKASSMSYVKSKPTMPETDKKHNPYTRSMYETLLNKPRYEKHPELMTKSRRSITIDWR